MNRRESALLLEKFPCECNFHSDGPRTLNEANELAGSQICPNILNCGNGKKCVLALATCIARDRINGNTAKKTEELLGVMDPETLFFWSPDREKFLLLEKKEAIKKIEEFVQQLLEG